MQTKLGNTLPNEKCQSPSTMILILSQEDGAELLRKGR